MTRHQLIQTRTYADGVQSVHESTHEGSAEDAFFARVNRLRKTPTTDDWTANAGTLILTRREESGRSPDLHCDLVLTWKDLP